MRGPTASATIGVSPWRRSSPRMNAKEGANSKQSREALQLAETRGRYLNDEPPADEGRLRLDRRRHSDVVLFLTPFGGSR
jgi:hypothetical protein